MKPLLDVHDVSYSYHTLSGETKALNRLSFQVQFNEFLGIVGPSGCGKSTILSLIFGLLSPESGEIKIHEALCKDHTMPMVICCKKTICWNGGQFMKIHCLDWKSTAR